LYVSFQYHCHVSHWFDRICKAKFTATKKKYNIGHRNVIYIIIFFYQRVHSYLISFIKIFDYFYDQFIHNLSILSFIKCLIVTYCIGVKPGNGIPTFLCISHGILQLACAIKETNKRLDQSENQNDISFWPLGVVSCVVFLVGSVFLIFLVFCVVFLSCLSSFCSQCCLCLWIVHSWLLLRFFLTFIYMILFIFQGPQKL
jgi:hypothetical protein